MYIFCNFIISPIAVYWLITHNTNRYHHTKTKTQAQSNHYCCLLNELEVFKIYRKDEGVCERAYNLAVPSVSCVQEDWNGALLGCTTVAMETDNSV